MMNRQNLIQILLVVFGALLGVSCEMVEIYSLPQEDKEIVLRPYSSVHTKSGSLDKNFGVYALASSLAGETAWSETLNSGVVDYLNNVGFKPEGKGIHPYYWPLSGSLLFSGYAPHADASNGAIDKTKVIGPNTEQISGIYNPYMTIPFVQNTDLASMVDLLWFDVTDVSSGKSMERQVTSVPVVFKHAMSQVIFNFTDPEAHYKVTASLKNCINAGTFYSGTNPGWIPDTESFEDYTLLSETLLSSSPESVSLYLVPQNLDGEYTNMRLSLGVDVILELFITGYDGVGGQTIELPLKDYTTSEDIMDWYIGKKYTYNIIVTSQKIQIAAPVVEHRDDNIIM